MDTLKYSSKNTVQKACNILEAMWCPANAGFRDAVNTGVHAALEHAKQHKETSLISKVISSIADKNAKQEIAGRISRQFPLVWLPQREVFKRRKSIDWDHENNFEAIPLKDTAYKETKGEVMLEKISLSSEEFVDFMLDTLVLNRKNFKADDVEKIEETLTRIKNRLEKWEKE